MIAAPTPATEAPIATLVVVERPDDCAVGLGDEDAVADASVIRVVNDLDAIDEVRELKEVEEAMLDMVDEIEEVGSVVTVRVAVSVEAENTVAVAVAEHMGM